MGELYGVEFCISEEFDDLVSKISWDLDSVVVFDSGQSR